MTASNLDAIMAQVFNVAKAMDTGRLSDHRTGIADVRNAIDALERLPPSTDKAREAMAIAHQLLFMLALEVGDVDLALDSVDAAETWYKRASSDGRRYAMFLHDVTVALHEIDAPKEYVLQWGDRAREAMHRTGLLKVRFGRPHKFDRYLDSIRQGATTTSADLGALRKDLRRARRADRAGAAQALAMALLSCEERSPTIIREMHDAFQTAFEDSFGNPTGLQNASDVLSTMIELHFEDVNWPDWVPDAADRLVASAVSRGRDDLASMGYTVRGLGELRAGRTIQALVPLLRAVAHRDQHSLRTESSIVRAIRGRATEYSRQFALQAAIDLEDHALAAELIESARMQVLPEINDSRAGASAVTGFRPVGWGKDSRLAQFYTVPIGPVLDLQEWIRQVGGPTANWYGTWAANEWMYWSWYSDGALTSGAIHIGEGSPRHQVFLDGVQDTPQSGANTRKLLAGVWSRSSLADEIAAAELGDLLICDEAKAVLKRSALADWPESLVVSGNLFAVAPPALLAIRLDDGFSSKRLIELAVVRVAPPAIFVARATPRSATAGHRRVKVACVNPSDNLMNANYEPDEAEVTLRGGLTSAETRATKSNLVAALRLISPGTEGLFFYTGHASGGVGDNEDGLSLADKEVLSASEIFAGAATNDGPWFPTTVILSACSTSGAQGAGAGEWFGLAAALLFAGASHVICTAWNIWDTGHTRQLDEWLVRVAQTGADPAVALRDVQLEALAEWRQSTHDFDSKDDLTADELATAHHLPFPLIWGAFMCVTTST